MSEGSAGELYRRWARVRTEVVPRPLGRGSVVVPIVRGVLGTALVGFGLDVYRTAFARLFSRAWGGQPLLDRSLGAALLGMAGMLAGGLLLTLAARSWLRRERAPMWEPTLRSGSVGLGTWTGRKVA